MLGEDGYGLTVSARRPEKLEAAAKELADAGFDVQSVPVNMADEDAMKGLVEAHKDKFGRLDVLINNAGVGIGEAMDSLTTKYVDMMLDVNFKAVILMTRESLPLLREAGGDHGKALIVNTASISGKAGQPWLSVYSATKAAVIGFSQATQREVAGQGIQVTALAPAFVDTPMTKFVKEQGVEAEEMIQPEDIAESVRFLLKTSRNCLVPEIAFVRKEDMGAAGGLAL
jgi:NAD(P)-dependent dehydrogenase (short-subunit alcohol dehydrogenase family)